MFFPPIQKQKSSFFVFYYFKNIPFHKHFKNDFITYYDNIDFIMIEVNCVWNDELTFYLSFCSLKACNEVIICFSVWKDIFDGLPNNNPQIT
jgi:hypothetical protein